jgi:hypothetical protein
MTTKYGLLVTNGADIASDEFREMVSVNAYYRAEKRGFEPGHEMDDWHEAELEIISQYRYLMRKPNPISQ